MKIPYTVIRSNRKTLAVRITDGGKIEVRAPLRASSAQIERIVSDNEAFILKHMSRLSEIADERRRFKVTLGSRILYLGREYEIKGITHGIVGFDGKSFFAPDGILDGDLKVSLIRLYKLLAANHIKPLACREAEKLGLSPKSIKINSAKTRWGSCGAKNTLNFSWRLIMADEEAVRYVVLHELAHMYEHNHSERFWAKLCELVPDYKKCEKSLGILSQRLSRENWE